MRKLHACPKMHQNLEVLIEHTRPFTVTISGFHHAKLKNLKMKSAGLQLPLNMKSLSYT
jgi:hypothetical protein